MRTQKSKSQKMETCRQFIPEIQEVDEVGHLREKNLCIRFCKKKFKCLIIFMLMIVVIFETIALIINKTSSISDLPTIKSIIDGLQFLFIPSNLTFTQLQRGITA